MASALEDFFDVKDGNLANIGASERTKLADNIGLIATGQRSLPNYIVFDRGEGQIPNDMQSTFLSLAETNKLRIPFVQGKFNMGGTGVLRFCGTRSLQLIISRKHPKIADTEIDDNNCWSFTLVRRDNPSEGFKNSIFRYLAPEGRVLRFFIKSLSIPKTETGQLIRDLEWGTIIKLFEYEMTGFRTNIKLDLYNQISLLLPRVGLPIRFYERRYESHSPEATMSGLHVRLDEDKSDNLELGFPTSAEFSAAGQKFSALIYAFKRDSHVKYKKNEGVLFTYSGQTQGTFPKSFFTRRNIGMSYLADSILIIVDCDEIGFRTYEILFMNSRDRLSSADLRNEIEQKLQDIIANHQGLKELRERRKREATESMLADMKPLRDALVEILKKSPSLQALFLKGKDISNPFKSIFAGEADEFIGKTHPTYFRLMKGHDHKQCHINQRFRVQFETDVVNDYFIRDRYPGRLIFNLNGSNITDRSFNLWNGVATLTVKLPNNIKLGEKVIGEVRVEDDTLMNPFYSKFTREVIGPSETYSGGNGRLPPAGNGKGDRQLPDTLSLPPVHQVREEEWKIHDFDRFSALKVMDDGKDSYDFYVNIDNVFLRTEIKALNPGSDPRLLEARYEYGLVLFGLAILKDKALLIKQETNTETNISITDLIYKISQAVSPIILPMIEALSHLESSDLVNQTNLEYED
jgi:hypothetical protein